MNHKEFAKARNVLKMKQKQLKSQGLGNKPKTAEALSDEHLDKMYAAKTLGDSNARCLIYSMWLICTTFFGMRTGQEIHSLRWGDISLGIDDKCGTEYIILDTERQTKTRTGINPKDTRLVKPRAYANPNEPQKDPVHLYKTYQEKRPADMNTADSPFFLTPASGGQLSWFRKSAIGINKLYGIMTEMKDAAGIEAPRVTPYSARKRLVQKLNDDGVPPTQIIQISGHKNVNSLNNYSHMNTEQCKHISNILSNSKSLENRKYTPPTSTVTTKSLQGSPNQSGTIPTEFFTNPIFHGPVNFTFSTQSLSQLTSVTQTDTQPIPVATMPASPVTPVFASTEASVVEQRKRLKLVHYSDSE